MARLNTLHRLCAIAALVAPLVTAPLVAAAQSSDLPNDLPSPGGPPDAPPNDPPGTDVPRLTVPEPDSIALAALALVGAIAAARRRRK